MDDTKTGEPFPSHVGELYLFSLSSYDPVQIEVVVPRVTEADIDYAIQVTLDSMGLGDEELNDALVAEKLENVDTVAELREVARKQVGEANMQLAERSKGDRCATELAKRLNEAVPPELVEQARGVMRQAFEHDLAAEGMTMDEFIEQVGATQQMMEDLFASQAEEAIQEEAALDAYAREKKIGIRDDELAEALELSPEEFDQACIQAQKAGAMDSLRMDALRAKVANILAGECSCIYKSESEQDAQSRMEQFRRLQQMRDDAKVRVEKIGGDHPGFRLV